MAKMLQKIGKVTLMQRARLRNISLLILIVAVTAGSTAQQEQSPAGLKLHKQFITVSLPDEDGLVLVHGATGAIESTGPISLRIVNLTTKAKLPMQLNPDRTFQAAVAAQPGEKIRIYARNKEGKQSYGTFTIPAAAPATPLTVSSPIATAAANPADASITVIITVIDTNNGDILASKCIAVPTAHKPASPSQLAHRIITQCSTAIDSLSWPKDKKTLTLPPTDPNTSQQKISIGVTPEPADK